MKKALILHQFIGQLWGPGYNWARVNPLVYLIYDRY